MGAYSKSSDLVPLGKGGRVHHPTLCAGSCLGRGASNPGLGVRSAHHPNVASGDVVTTAHDVDGPDTRAHGADRGTGHRFHPSLETRAEDLSRRPTATWTT